MSKLYQIIYADPPWSISFGVDNHRDRRESTGGYKGTWSKPQMSYQTLSLDEIKNLDVASIAADDSVLFLWLINRYIRQGYDVAENWGFRPVTLLTWAKTPRGLGLGGTFVQTTEHLLFCRKGNLKTANRIDTTWWNWTRPEKQTGPKHSRKPDDVYGLIEQAFGDLLRVELFARQKRMDWDVWGNEVYSDVVLSLPGGK